MKRIIIDLSFNCICCKNHVYCWCIIATWMLHKICKIYITMVFCVKLRKLWYKWFASWSHTISHLGRWLLHCSLRIIKLQPRFKVCNITYLCVLFHSSYLLLTFSYINHKKIKGKECIHVFSKQKYFGRSKMNIFLTNGVTFNHFNLLY